MEFRIETSELQRVLKSLGAVARVNTSEVEGRILIEADSDANSVLFMAKNDTLSVSKLVENVPVKVSGTESVLFSELRSFGNAYTPWNEDEDYGVKDFSFLKTDTRTLSVNIDGVFETGKNQRGRLKLNTFDAFAIQRHKAFGHAQFILNSDTFKAALSKVLYAIDPKARDDLRGMNVAFSKDLISFAGSNGIILSEYEVENNGEIKEGSLILRYDLLLALRNILEDDSQLFIEINDTPKSIGITFNNVYFFAISYEDIKFPEYKHFFDGFDNSIQIDRKSLMGLLSPFSDLLDGSDYNRLTTRIKDNLMVFESDKLSVEYDGHIDYDGEFVVQVDGKCALQAIDTIKDDDVVMLFKSSDQSPLLFDSLNGNSQKAMISSIRMR